MIETIFFDSLLNLYNQIKFDIDEADLSKIDTNITYYLADKKKQFILANNPNIVEVDIVSAFPTIVNCLFDKNSTFLQNLNSMSGKKQKNIFIATSLKETEYLRRLNIICKIIIYGFIKENTNDFLLLELKKDGILLQLDNENYDQLILAINGEEYYKNSLTEFIYKNNFKFHLTNYNSYLRCNSTSFFTLNNELIIKGKYKYLPDKLFEFLTDYLNGKKIDLYELKTIYSKLFYKTIQINYLKEYINNYYVCNNQKVLNFENKYVNYSIHTNIDPLIYMRNFVYPLIASKRF